ncbi:MAG: cytochrome c [Bacteriovoracaceae bacterium]|nr:cytochrome c [Bacteriovoracaceae bacterium]
MYKNGKIKYFYFFIFTAALTYGGADLFLKSLYSTTITIESEESKTQNLTSVYNQIKWTSTATKDIWMMNQSHYGRFPKKDLWERLAIVIDKSKRPMIANYYQLSPGPLEWNDNLPAQRVAYRASCFICHNNGPRAIRPVFKSESAALSLSEKIKIIILNFRMKTYGRIKYDDGHNQEDLTLSTPFHYRSPRELEELQVKTCLRCHQEEGLFARGKLVRQQTGTIKHLVESGSMPPMGFSLSDKEKKQLTDFLRGF